MRPNPINRRSASVQNTVQILKATNPGCIILESYMMKYFVNDSNTFLYLSEAAR